MARLKYAWNYPEISKLQFAAEVIFVGALRGGTTLFINYANV